MSSPAIVEREVEVTVCFRFRSPTEAAAAELIETLSCVMKEHGFHFTSGETVRRELRGAGGVQIEGDRTFSARPCSAIERMGLAFPVVTVGGFSARFARWISGTNVRIFSVDAPGGTKLVRYDHDTGEVMGDLPPGLDRESLRLVRADEQAAGEGAVSVSTSGRRADDAGRVPPD